MAYTAAGLTGEKLFQVTHQRHHVISWSTAIASAVPRRLPALPIFRIPSAGQGALRSGSRCPRRWLPGFEFQAVTHTTSVIFKVSRAVVPNGSSHRPGFFTRPRSPSAWCQHLYFSRCSDTTPAVSEDRRNVTQGFDVVNAGCLPHAPEVAGKGGFERGLARALPGS